MANEVVIVLKATDQASAAIKKASGSLDSLGKSTKGLQGHWDKLKTAVPGLGSAMAAVVNPITLVVGGLTAAGSVIRDSVGDWVDYNKEIREMTQVTGVGAEEISRIVQAADDWGIEIGSLRTALAMMNKNGVTPSIDNLAKLADEYVAASDKSAWAEEAVKILGKGYETLIPLLAGGGDKLREWTDAVDDSLIATDESIKAARDYEVAVDTLGDTWTGVKNTIGQAVVPVLNELLGAVNDGIQATKDYNDVEAKYQALVDAGIIDNEKYTQSFDDFGTGVSNARVPVQDMQKAIEDATAALEADGQAAYDAAKAYTDQFSPEISEADRLAGVIAYTLNEQTTPALNDLEDGGIDVRDAIMDVAGQFDAAKAAGDLFSEGLKTLTDSTYDQQYWANLLAFTTGQITEEAYLANQEILAQYKAMEDLNQAYEDGYINRGDWLAAMADGIVTQQEVNDLLGTQTDEITEANLQAQDFYSLLAAKDGKHYSTYVDTYYTDYGGGGGGGSGKGGGGEEYYAKGTDFIIPPGYEDDSYPIGYGKSGERVIVIPQGEPGNSTTNNFNMNVHTNAGVSTLQSDFDMMRTMAG